MSLPPDPAGRHRAVAAGFTDRVRGVGDWDAPAPVAGWTARDVVGHLVEWFPAFVASGSTHRWDAGPPVADDPLGAWQAQTDGVQRLLEDPEAAGSLFRHPRVPEQSLAETVSAFYTADVFMHTWDLARASGQDDSLDPDLCAELLAGMEQVEPMIRESGQFGTRQPVPARASVQDRLVAFIGRDPQWTA